MDIKAKSEDTAFDIEIQCHKTKDIPERALFYASKLFTDQLPKGERYNTAKVISIWIFGENVTERKNAINEAYMTFQKNNEDPFEILTDHIKIVYLELNKYDTTFKGLHDILPGWISFLRNPMNVDSRFLDNKEISKAKEELEYISTDDKERGTIEAFRDGLRDQLSRETIAREEGREEGAYLKSIETARNLLKSGIDIKIIVSATGLSIDEIKKITQN